MTIINVYKVVVSTLVFILEFCIGVILYKDKMDSDALRGVLTIAVVLLLAFVGMWV